MQHARYKCFFGEIASIQSYIIYIVACTYRAMFNNVFKTIWEWIEVEVICRRLDYCCSFNQNVVYFCVRITCVTLSIYPELWRQRLTQYSQLMITRVSVFIHTIKVKFRLAWTNATSISIIPIQALITSHFFDEKGYCVHTQKKLLYTLRPKSWNHTFVTILLKWHNKPVVNVDSCRCFFVITLSRYLVETSTNEGVGGRREKHVNSCNCHPNRT